MPHSSEQAEQDQRDHGRRAADASAVGARWPATAAYSRRSRSICSAVSGWPALASGLARLRSRRTTSGTGRPRPRPAPAWSRAHRRASASFGAAAAGARRRRGRPPSAIASFARQASRIAVPSPISTSLTLTILRSSGLADGIDDDLLLVARLLRRQLRPAGRARSKGRERRRPAPSRSSASFSSPAERALRNG